MSSVTGGTPKQFWSPDGGPSLLEATLDRVAPLAPIARTVVVVDQSHVRFVEPRRWQAGTVVAQPLDRGTAAGVLLAISPVLEADPEAIVLLTPSDHGVADVRQFHESITAGADLVHRGVVEAVVFGATPTTACPDYGWIVPGAIVPNAAGLHARRVQRFVEKPPAEEASWLAETGGLWSTMVTVARASTLRRLFALHLPELASIFYTYRRLPAGDRASFLAERYSTLTAADFSRDVLGRVRRLAVHVWPASMGWADLGTPQRLSAWAAGQRGLAGSTRRPAASRRELLTPHQPAHPVAS